METEKKEQVEQIHFKHADDRARAKVTGITVFACTGTCFAVSVLIMATNLALGMISGLYFGIYIGLELLSLGGAAFFFAKDVTDQKVNIFVTISMAVLLVMSGFAFDSYYLSTLILMPFMATILQYNVKITRLNFIIIGGLNLLIPIIRNMTNKAYADSGIFFEIMCQGAVVALLMANIWLCSAKLRKIQRDVIGKLKYDEGVQVQMLSEVMAISETVSDEAVKTNSLLADLVSGSDAVRDSIEEVADVAINNSGAVEKQTIKTKEIQDSVQNTAQKTENLARIAEDVTLEVKKGLKSLDELSESTRTIEGVTGKVVNQMQDLNNSMEEMKGFAESILSISNQTNLLALNASIESARAGEAGRGFAVVADQIRVLSEQTKNATGKITSIIEELFDRTREVSDSINESIGATANQTELIKNVNSNFNSTGDKIEVLGSQVGEIRENIEGLKEANSEIVDNIAQISASCEELTATTQNITAIATKNGEDANDAKNALGRMVDETAKFEKYKQQTEE